MPISASQGISFPGVSGATNIKLKMSRPDPMGQRLESSDLSIPEFGSRTYEAGMTDAGPAAPDGISVSAEVSFFGTGPAKGDIVTFQGYELRCENVEQENAVGELVKGTASYSSFTP
jgi:hypothetical protein